MTADGKGQVTGISIVVETSRCNIGERSKLWDMALRAHELGIMLMYIVVFAAVVRGWFRQVT